MKKPICIILKILAVLAVIPIGFSLLFFALFGWEGITFESRVREVKEHYDSLTPGEYERIIEASQQAIQLWELSDNKYIRYRKNPTEGLEGPIPKSLEYLNPRRVDISEDRVCINFLFMMDSGASIIVKKTNEGSWVILGEFYEHEPSYEIFCQQRKVEQDNAP